MAREIANDAINAWWCWYYQALPRSQFDIYNRTLTITDHSFHTLLWENTIVTVSVCMTAEFTSEIHTSECVNVGWFRCDISLLSSFLFTFFTTDTVQLTSVINGFLNELPGRHRNKLKHERIYCWGWSR